MIKSDNFEKYIEDLEFIEWVNSDFKIHAEKWSKVQNADSQNVSQAIAFVESLNFEDEEINPRLKSELFNKIEDSIDAAQVVKLEPKTSKRNIRYLVPALVAASLLLLVTFFFPSSDLVEFNTDLAEISKHQLPEASTITLNAGSKISYSESKFTEKRTLNFEGEGFFDVEKGSRFTVETSLGKVEVLGTSFNVHARENTFEVFCRTGKVKVSNPESNSFVILTPGESSVMTNNKISKLNIDNPSDSWLNGKFYYKNKSLGFIAKEIERQFDVTINIDPVKAKELYTGFFENKDINEALKSVCWPLNLSFEKTSKGTFTIK